MSVLITGGSSWSARPLVSALARRGESGIVYDLALPGGLPEGWSWAEGDVRDAEALAAAISGSSAVIHFAVAPADRASPTLAFDVNVRGTHEVLAAARAGGASRVVLIGSAPVHLPARPDDPHRCDPGADFVYDLTKLLQEAVAAAHRATFTTKTLVLRAGHLVDGPARVDAKGRTLDALDYCRGGWLCRHDLARGVAAALTSDTTGVRTLVGASPGYERFGTAEAEAALGIRLEERFEDYPG